MPQILRIGPYVIFFWSNENEPLEAVHVHIAKGKAGPMATKVWITQSGKSLLCHNNGKIPEHILRDLLRLIEANSATIVEKWLEYFGEITYFC